MQTEIETDDRGSDAGPRPCSMREACGKAGLDDDGDRCPSCPLRRLCLSELRWLVQIAQRPRYPS
jgi:hypothetical protein